MIKIADFPTAPPSDISEKEAEKALASMAKEIGELAIVMSAQKKHSLLVVFQGMDASGKDGALKNVFGATTPLCVSAHSFKKPTEEEFAHDFLWRCHKLAPAKGHISVFVRSHYEDILIQKVHNWIDDDKRASRMKSINAFETLLQKDNNTTILKFYMNISLERQEEKLQERLDQPEKQWKHNAQDWEERKLWSQYMDAYEYAINNSDIPWIIAPVDSRWYRNFFIAEKILETMKEMNLVLPTIDKDA